MQVGGCEPNAASYRMMVDGFCHTEDFEGFDCNEMEKRNMQFHLEAWEALVMGACGEDIVAGDVATELGSAH
ncbi:hypothetical protein EV1_006460 [Malus domestica]